MMVGKAQMIVFDVYEDKNQFNLVSANYLVSAN